MRRQKVKYHLSMVFQNMSFSKLFQVKYYIKLYLYIIFVNIVMYMLYTFTKLLPIIHLL